MLRKRGTDTVPVSDDEVSVTQRTLEEVGIGDEKPENIRQAISHAKRDSGRFHSPKRIASGAVK